MLLRIADTDRERLHAEAIDAILDGLKWLGLDWDGETIYQFARASRHAEVAPSSWPRATPILLRHAPTLNEMREKAKAEGRPMRYDGAAGATAIPQRRPPASSR